jgi:hypothetical protein
MSKSRTDLKSALRSLDVSKPLRIPPQLGFAAPKAPSAPVILMPPIGLNTEESGSFFDPVISGPGQNLTGSKNDPVNLEPCKQEIIEEKSAYSAESTGSITDPVTDLPGQISTGLKNDPVTARPCQKRTGSKFDPVSVAPKGFTRVPNLLLRMDQPFSEPVDFMIYLHLFTYSHGFGRETASMSQAQLERFTGAVRNTVRKSIERLTQQGWIECIEEYEASRMSRKWKVRAIGESHPKDPAPITGSNSDPVKNSPGHTLTQTGSKNDPVTGSKFNPYKESSNKEPTKNSLSRTGAREAGESRDELSGSDGIESEVLREYFGHASMTPRKRQSEMLIYQELRGTFRDEQIAECLTFLRTHGLPSSGEPCHSPMAFLSKAMGQVLGLVQAEACKRDEAQARVERERVAQECKAREAAEEELRVELLEAEFLRRYPSEESQEEVLGPYRQQFGMFVRQPGVLRRLAIGAWSSQLKLQELEEIPGAL